MEYNRQFDCFKAFNYIGESRKFEIYSRKVPSQVRNMTWFTFWYENHDYDSARRERKNVFSLLWIFQLSLSPFSCLLYLSLSLYVYIYIIYITLSLSFSFFYIRSGALFQYFSFCISITFNHTLYGTIFFFFYNHIC